MDSPYLLDILITSCTVTTEWKCDTVLNTACSLRDPHTYMHVFTDLCVQPFILNCIVWHVWFYLRSEVPTHMYIFTDSDVQTFCLKLVYCLIFILWLFKKWKPNICAHFYWCTKKNKNKTPPVQTSNHFSLTSTATVWHLCWHLKPTYMSSQTFGVWHTQERGMQALP